MEQSARTRVPARRLRATAVAAVAIVLYGATAACGGGAGSSPTTAALPPAVKTAAPTKIASVPAGAPAIDQLDLAFKPSHLEVPVGSTVYFKNSEQALHTVNVDGKNISGNMRIGDIVSWKFPSAGQYQITCDYHLDMHAVITVQ